MWRSAAKIGAVGLEMGLAVGIGALGGAWLDGKFGTTPILGIIGLLIGIGAAGKALWDTARRLSRDQTKPDDE
jgi:F0F1-type ATP synthase assembly protein I